ncbi:alpha/beta fold hydrolase [Paenarthrobacter sp. NCHU4564]|uniref:alpha/beta fold hydrolase n=1 Tax=Paenarthrobacter sp. NCHU4564 TaxID=3451353 RepID=UPI003F9A6578
MESEVRTVVLKTGIRLRCFIQGSPDNVHDGGTPLVLLHAWTESWGSFERLIAALPDRALVVPDLRGHGGSDKPSEGYSLETMAGDVASLLTCLGVTKAHVLGSSSGGYVAQQLAVMHPELLASLILVGAPLSLQGRPPFADEVAQLKDPIPEGWVRESLSWFKLLHVVPSAYIEDRVRDGLAVPAALWNASLKGLYEAVPPTEAGRIWAPTLILWGSHDHLLPRHHQDALVGRIPDAQLKIYQGTGHLVLWECPERVAEDVLRFLRKQRE